MSENQNDSHGNAPDRSDVALILIDVINDLEFAGGELLPRYALPAAENIARLKKCVATDASSSESRYPAFGPNPFFLLNLISARKRRRAARNIHLNLKGID